MPWLLNFLYFAVALVSLPVLIFRVCTRERYRAGLWQRMGFPPRRAGDRPCAWVHAASVGEVSVSRTLVRAIEREFPGWDVVVSTNTNTGQNMAKKNFPRSLTFYFPFDFTGCVRSTLRRIRPSCILLVELELWPNFLRVAHERSIRVAVVNGRITEKAARWYRRLRAVTPGLFTQWGPEMYCVQNETYARRLQSLGVSADRIEVVGTMKFDALPQPDGLPPAATLAETLGIGNGERVLVGGCTWPGEEEALLRAFDALKDTFAPLRLVLAPRHIERADEVERLIKNAGFPCARKTQIDAGANGDGLKKAVILVDTIGDLLGVYGLATVVFVGKSLVPLGGQNIMEPAALAKPVLFGPHVGNFEDEAALLLQAGAAGKVLDETELVERIRGLLDDPAKAAEMGRRAQQAANSRRGATERHMHCLRSILSGKKEGGK